MRLAFAVGKMEEEVIPGDKLHCLEGNTDFPVFELVQEADFEHALFIRRIPAYLIDEFLNGLHGELLPLPVIKRNPGK